VSCVAVEELKSEYLKQLNTELVFRAREYRNRYEVTTIYIGGGTPSSLRMNAIKNIMHTILNNFSVKNDAEITIEMNPNDLTDAKLNEYLEIGINRFSIGLQTSNDRILKIIGRTHTLLNYQITVNRLINRGVSNISTDIILGLPGQTLKDVEETLKVLLDLKIPHISAYMLQLEEGTPLKKLVDDGTLSVPNEEQTVAMYRLVCNTLASKGYEHYEISNFALPNFASKHNKVYWDGGDYLGVGASAHSLIFPYRMANTENIKEYIEVVKNQRLAPISDVYKLTPDMQKEERIMLRLRTKDGLNLNEYERDFKENLVQKKKSEIFSLIKNKFLVLDANYNLKATEAGFLVLNEIIRQLV